ncbi:putative enterotoxin [Ophiocordyceps camponoti-floridani]|uniref:Putative enterotoxin n=1 Tax=Ophiocordyceps camponoti-floridani TaxID=2030778 RepID=A0A8H4Q0X0_9HYPO|nr:putative enterotoxin [Ophiocordyceps camponoti-floridani]
MAPTRLTTLILYLTLSLLARSAPPDDSPPQEGSQSSLSISNVTRFQLQRRLRVGHRPPSEELPQYLFFITDAAPGFFRAAGGIIPLLTPDQRDHSWGFMTFGREGGPWVPLDDRHTADTRPYQEFRAWIYEISTSPNMVAGGVHTCHGRHYWALGGVHWSQVRRYGFRERHGSMSMVTWSRNADYDSRWERYSACDFQPQLAGFDRYSRAWGRREGFWRTERPPRGVTRRDLAELHMNLITRRDPLLTRMLGWQGRFPLINQRNPVMAIRITWHDYEAIPSQDISWQNLEIPQRLRDMIPSAPLTHERCYDIITAVVATNWLYTIKMSSRARQRRSLPDSDEDFCFDPEPEPFPPETECHDLTPAFKELRSLDAMCSAFNRLEFYLELSNDLFAGTWDVLYLRLGGAYRSVEVNGNISPGEKGWYKLNMRTMYGRETVPVEVINSIAILERIGHKLMGGDEWKLKGIKLQGTCQDDLTTYEMKKYAAVQQLIRMRHRLSWPWSKQQLVWNRTIDPSDWQEVVFCPYFDRLTVHIYLGYWDSPDNVFIQIGREQYSIINPSFDVDLSKSFGPYEYTNSQNKVLISDFQNFTIFYGPRDRASKTPSDALTLKGIQLIARCAHSGQRVEFTNHNNLNKPVIRPADHTGKVTIFFAKLTAHDWAWIVRP